MRQDPTWWQLVLMILLFVGLAAGGLWFGYHRYIGGTDAEVRQAAALERIATTLERIAEPGKRE